MSSAFDLNETSSLLGQPPVERPVERRSGWAFRAAFACTVVVMVGLLSYGAGMRSIAAGTLSLSSSESDRVSQVYRTAPAMSSISKYIIDPDATHIFAGVSSALEYFALPERLSHAGVGSLICGVQRDPNSGHMVAWCEVLDSISDGGDFEEQPVPVPATSLSLAAGARQTQLDYSTAITQPLTEVDWDYDQSREEPIQVASDQSEKAIDATTTAIAESEGNSIVYDGTTGEEQLPVFHGTEMEQRAIIKAATLTAEGKTVYIDPITQKVVVIPPPTATTTTMESTTTARRGLLSSPSSSSSTSFTAPDAEGVWDHFLAFAHYMPFTDNNDNDNVNVSSMVEVEEGHWGCTLGPRQQAYTGPGQPVLPLGFIVAHYVECVFPGFVNQDQDQDQDQAAPHPSSSLS